MFSPPSSRKSVPLTKATPSSAAALKSRATSVPGRQRDPHEVAAVGLHELGLGQLAPQRFGERQGALGERRAHGLDRALDRAGGAELVDDRLRDHARRDVRVGRELGDLCDQLGRADEVADADAGANGLRERGGVDDALGVHREHRRQRLAAEAQRDVGVVLEHEEVVLGGEAEQRLALGQRQRVAGGVLEVGDDVGELRARLAGGEQVRERVGVDPVGLQLDRVQRGAALAQREQRAVVGGALDDDVVAGAHEAARRGRRRPASSRW